MSNRRQKFRDTPGARDWVAEFWNAKEDYSWAKTRSCVDTTKASWRMRHAVDALYELGLFPENAHERMPTLDEMDRRT